MPGYELTSLEQRHGWNAWQAFPKPQGLEGPKFAEVLHALLNTVPEMQHWPSGNDIAPRAGTPVSPDVFRVFSLGRERSLGDSHTRSYLGAQHGSCARRGRCCHDV